MRRILLWAAFSLVGCTSVPLPHTNICVANPGLNKSKCYWIDKDYDSSGNLKPDAVPNYIPLNTIQDMNKAIWTDPDGWAELKAYMRQLREEAIKRLNEISNKP